MLQLKNIHKTYKTGDLDVTALKNVSLSFRDHEFVSILGPSGCGKTTFLNSLTKLYDITSGEILVNGEPVDLKKHNVAYIFQEYSTMPWLKVEENIRFGLELKKLPEKEIQDRANRVIQMVGLNVKTYNN